MKRKILVDRSTQSHQTINLKMEHKPTNAKSHKQYQQTPKVDSKMNRKQKPSNCEPWATNPMHGSTSIDEGRD